jgi:cell division protease FtsH
LETSPERFKSIQVGPSVISFLFEGKRYVTQIVQVNEGVLKRLLQSGADFAAREQPMNVLGLIWGAVYLYVLWQMVARMQGPRDENVGKSRDQMGLGSYGELSFDDIAGQDKAKLEVKEVCDMLRSPESYNSLGARLPSGVLLCGPPGKLT